MPNHSPQTQRARQLREKQTEAESLLWQLLRAKQLCGLKFRRQYPEGPYFADFACLSHKTIVELDGGYHEHRELEDDERQKYLEECGWKVFRFLNADILEDVEAVGVSIARKMGLQYQYTKRNWNGSGMMHFDSPNKKELAERAELANGQASPPRA